MSTNQYKKKSKTVSKLEGILGEEMTLAGLLHSTRLAMELTQESFGEILGVNKSYICDIEKGRKEISIEQAIKFATLLKKSKVLYVQLAIQDQCRKFGMELKVNITQKAS